MKDINKKHNEQLTTDEFNENIVEGRNAVMEAIKSGRDINKILIADGNREGSIKKIISLAKEKKIVLQYVDKNVVDKASGNTTNQGVLAYVAVKNYCDLDDILSNIEKNKQIPFLLILDNISDPHNFGAIIRTAESVGVHGIIIPKRRSVALNSTVAKVSAGAIEYMPVARVVNISQTIEYLKSKNIWIVGTEMNSRSSFYEIDYNMPVALVIGSEGEGISKNVLNKCDLMVNIPMVGKISSLNASVASAIVMYEVLKQRLKSKLVEFEK